VSVYCLPHSGMHACCVFGLLESIDVHAVALLRRYSWHACCMLCRRRSCDTVLNKTSVLAHECLLLLRRIESRRLNKGLSFLLRIDDHCIYRHSQLHMLQWTLISSALQVNVSAYNCTLQGTFILALVSEYQRRLELHVKAILALLD